MRRKGHFFRILLTAVLLLGLLPLNIWAAEGQSAGEATVLFTHDLHSCFFPRVQEGGEAAVPLGGVGGRRAAGHARGARRARTGESR